MRLLKVSPAKIVACSDKLFAHSISHSLLQALEACLCPMVMLVGEAVRRLRDNEAGLVQLEGLRGKWGGRMREAEVRELAGALAVNTTLTKLHLAGNKIRSKGAAAIAHVLEVNKALIFLDLRFNRIGGKGARKIAKALQVNHVLTTLRLNLEAGLDKGLLAEVYRFVAVNRALDSKLLAVMMSMHARLGAESDLRELDQNLVRTMCDMFCREGKASCLLDDVEEEDSESDEEEGESEEEEEEEVEEDWDSEDSGFDL